MRNVPTADSSMTAREQVYKVRSIALKLGTPERPYARTPAGLHAQQVELSKAVEQRALTPAEAQPKRDMLNALRWRADRNMKPVR